MVQRNAPLALKEQGALVSASAKKTRGENVPLTADRKHLSRRAQALLAYMGETARFRDSLYFAADDTAARALGCSRMTVQRAKRELEASGVISRCSAPSKFRRTVCYRLPVTQRPSRAGKTPRATRFARSSGRASASAHRGRRRRLMERHPETLTDGIVRKDGSVTPWNAADILAAVIDKFREVGIPVPAKYKGQIARAAKGLLEDGFDAQTLVLASAIAIRRAEPHNLHHIAMDLVLSRGGMRMTRREYEKALQDEMEIGGLR